jgi:hypothetical protein
VSCSSRAWIALVIALMMTSMPARGRFRPGASAVTKRGMHVLVDWISWESAYSHYRELLAREAWLESSMGWTVVMPPGGPLNDAEVIGRLAGGRVTELRSGEVGEFDLEEHFTAVSIGRAGERSLLFEGAGLQGRRDDVLRRLSSGCGVYAIGWDIRGNNRFNHYEDGRMAASFDLAEPFDQDGPSIAAMAEDLDFLDRVLADSEGGHWRAAGLAIVERRTGVRLTSEWLAGSYPCLLILFPS